VVCVADAMRLENAVRPEKTTVSAAVPCAAGHALSKRFLPEVRPQLSEKERAEGRFGAKTRPEQADPSAGWRKGEIARRGPQTPRHARRRPLPRAPENGERRFHLEKMVEAVGIEPTSDGQSPRAATSVACVLLSPSITPTGRLDAGLVRAFSPPPYEPRGSGKLAGVCAQADLASPIGRTSPR